MDSAITSLAPWFGAKRTLASRIVAELGPHSAYWELFCGSMAVLLAKEPASSETVNDLHGDLVNLGRVVAHEELHRVLFKKLRRTFASRVLMDEAAARYRERGNTPATAPDLDRAYDYFLSTWLGRNGVAGTQSYNQGFCRRFTKSGGDAGKRWTSAVDSIPAWSHRLRKVTILSEDAFELLERIEDASGVVIYLDPPYIEKGARYVHDADDSSPQVLRILGIDDPAKLPTFAWHRALARLANRFKKTRVVISYYEHALLTELYPHWTKIPLKATKSLVNQGLRDSGGAIEAPEVLLINGPTLTQKRGELF